MRLPPRSGDQVRIGVAITIPEPYASVLHAARTRCGDPWAPYIRPHITLLGPTVIEPDDVARVDDHLAAVARRHAPFVVQLRGTGTFRPVSPVVFVRVADGVDGCAALEGSVRSGVLAQDVPFRYHPHVTVAHEVPDELLDEASADLTGFEASFRVDRFHTYEHGDDGVWRPSRDFSLTGSPADAEVSAAT